LNNTCIRLSQQQRFERQSDLALDPWPVQSCPGLYAFDAQFQVELGSPNRYDSQVTVDSDEGAVFQDLSCIADTVDTRDTKFSRDDRAVDQHSARAFDDGAGERDQVRHRWLDRVADEDFTLSELAEVAAPNNTANRAGGNTR